jgi:hypothetical protein
MLKSCLFLLIILTVFSSAGLSQAQIARLDSLERKLSQVDRQLTTLTGTKQQLVADLSSKSAELKKLREDANRNYFEHQRLQDLMRSSQEVSLEIERTSEQLDRLNDEYKSTVEKLIGAYEAELQHRVDGLNASTLSEKQKETQLGHINDMRKRMNILRATSDQLAVLNLKPVELTLQDTPKRIEQKADLVKDQEEKVRRFAVEINKEKEMLRKELNLRTRIGDLVTDLSLFDQQDEILTSLPSRESVSASLDEGQSRNQDFPDATAIPENSFIYEKSEVDGQVFISQKNFDFSKLSEEELEEAIEMMEKQYLRASSKADSLSQIAEKYYRTAKEQRDPKKP